MHRDYSEYTINIPISVAMYTNRLEITNSGVMVELVLMNLVLKGQRLVIRSCDSTRNIRYRRT